MKMQIDNKRKKVSNFILVVLIIFLSTFIVFFSINYLNIDKNIIKSSKKQTQSNNSLALMIETAPETGEYKVSTDSTWPEGYTFNSTLSKCENGSILTYDSASRKVKVQSTKSDKCYVYFDAQHDFNLTVANNAVSPGYYDVTTSCNNGSSVWSNKDWGLNISLTSKSNCTLSFTNKTVISNMYLNNYVISLAGTTQGNGQVVNEKGYRYEGKEPNNYVWFNNELWRIIGVFDSATHGQSGNLVKLIKDDTIGGLVWDKNNSTTWSSSSLNALLNNNYYNGINETTLTNCYGYSTLVPRNCNYVTKGITNASSRNMIQTARWNTTPATNSNGTPEVAYGNDIITTISSNENIGLMYASDYGYGVLGSSCARTTVMSSYINANCAGQNWLYGKGYEWLVSVYSSYYVLYMDGSGGYVNFNNSINGYSVRPVLYLKSSIYKIGGEGTKVSPYILGV